MLKHKRKIHGFFDFTAILSLLSSIATMIYPAFKYTYDTKIKNNSNAETIVEVIFYNSTKEVAKFKVNGYEFVVQVGETFHTPKPLEVLWKERGIMQPSFVLGDSKESNCPTVSLLDGKDVKYVLNTFEATIGNENLKKLVCSSIGIN